MKTGANVFLTGEPGSGKSYVAARYLGYLRRENIPASVTASTGIAAAQIGGTTVHAWSGIGTRSRITRGDLDGIAKNRRVTDRIRKARVLIVDEVSMLSGQTLSAVSVVCQFVRKNNAPFGGLQVVLVGDFFQLPPVIRRDERPDPDMFSQDEEDNLPFAYASRAWRDLDPSICYLTEQHRQSGAEFSSLLGAIRSNRFGKEDASLLTSRRLAQDSLPRSVTRLFTHNMDVDRINQAELIKLPGEPYSFHMTATGDKLLAEGLKRGCLLPERLDLKIGAVVMFTKNDPDGRFVNGTLGAISDFSHEDGYPVVITKSGQTVFTKPAEWKVNEDETVKAGIEQVPLRLAWAITVHKSQGMSLDAAVMDLSHAFEYGQGYVGCRVSVPWPACTFWAGTSGHCASTRRPLRKTPISAAPPARRASALPPGAAMRKPFSPLSSGKSKALPPRSPSRCPLSAPAPPTPLRSGRRKKTRTPRPATSEAKASRPSRQHLAGKRAASRPGS